VFELSIPLEALRPAPSRLNEQEMSRPRALKAQRA